MSSLSYAKRGFLVVLVILLSLQAVSALTPPSGGVSYWNFSQNFDLWGSADLTCTTCPTSISSFPVFNDTGNSSPNSYYFDGVNDYLITTSPTFLGETSGGVSMWINLDPAATGIKTIWGSGDEGSGTKFFYSYIRTDVGENYVELTSYDGDYNYALRTPVDSISDDTWHLITVTSSGSQVKIYIDGVEQTLTVAQGSNNGDWFGDIASLDNFAVGTLSYNSGTLTETMIGYIDEVKVFDREINEKEAENIYNCGSISCEEPPVVGDHFLESVSKVPQLANVSISSTSYVNVVNGTFNVANASSAYFSFVVGLDANNAQTVFCRGLLDGEVLGSEVSRSFTSAGFASVYLASNTTFLSAGSHELALQCRGNTGSNFKVFDSLGLVHQLVNNEGDNLTFYSDNLSLSIDSSSFVLLDSFLFNTSNTTAGGLSRKLVIDGAANYDYTSTGNLSFYVDVNGSASPYFIRYGLAGSSGSGGAFFASSNVSGNESINISFYGRGSATGEVNLDFVVKEFLLNDTETNSTGFTGLINTVWSNVSTLNLSNLEHANSAIVVKSTVSAYSDSGSQEAFFRIVLDDHLGTTRFRTLQDEGRNGVLILQEEFEDLIFGNYTVYLQARTETSSATISNGSLLAYVAEAVDFDDTSYLVTANDSFNADPILSFNVTDESGTVFESNSSGVALVVPNSAFEDLTITANNYFPSTYQDHNVLNDLAAEMNQSLVRFRAFTTVNNIELSGVNYTVTDGVNTVTVVGSNVTVGLSSGSYQVTSSKEGYFSITDTFTTTNLSNETINVENLYNSIVNVTLIDNWTNTNINIFNVTLTNDFYSYSQTVESTAGNATFIGLIQNLTYNVSVTPDLDKYNPVSVLEITPNSTYYDVELNTTPYNSVNITFRYINDTLIDGVTINLTFINSLEAFTNTTTNGFITVKLLSPDEYELRTSAVGFLDRKYFFLVTEQSAQQLTVYLTPNATTELQVFRILDTTNTEVSGAVLNVEKETVEGSNLYSDYAEELTNFEGKANVYLEKGINNYYRFSVSINGSHKRIYPTQNLYTSKTNFIEGVSEVVEIVIYLEEEEITDYYSDLYGIVTSMGFIGNDTVYYNWSDARNTISGAKLVVKGKFLDNTTSFETISTQTSSATSGSLTYTFTPINNTIYEVYGYIVYSDHEVLTDQEVKSYSVTSNVNKYEGLIYAAAILVVTALLSIYFGVMLSSVITVLMLVFTNLIGFTNFTTTTITSLLALVILLLIKVTRDE